MNYGKGGVWGEQVRFSVLDFTKSPGPSANPSSFKGLVPNSVQSSFNSCMNFPRGNDRIYPLVN